MYVTLVSVNREKPDWGMLKSEQSSSTNKLMGGGGVGIEVEEGNYRLKDN